ncbi:MAG: M20 family metallopeptidase [Oscillospiraceae bacterium]
MVKSKILELIDSVSGYVTDIRRELHRWPEISGQERHTRDVLIRELEQMGVPYRRIEGTGLIAFIEGAGPGKNRLLRADMDALPLQEELENLVGPKVCISEVDGACHACGHDAHMAMLLGTMRVLLSLKDELEGTVFCCFEEGEETNCGIGKMMQALSEYSFDECFALHVYADLDSGKLNISPGPRMAGTARIDMTIHGKAGHSSRPDKAANPIIPAAHIVTQLNSAFMNQLDAEETVTLGLCKLQAGELYNVIPETAQLSGTARFFNREEGRRALELVTRIAENTAACHGCTVSFNELHKITLDPVINDPVAAEELRRRFEGLFGGERLSDCDHWFASESYCRYLERSPGVLGFLGIRNPHIGSGAAHHNGKFDIDESALTVGVMAEICFAIGDMKIE